MKEMYEDFEEKFSVLLKKAKQKPISLKQVLGLLSGKGKLLFLIFFLLPFSQVPGIAIIFGLLISYIGLRIAFHKQSIWLPKKIQKKKIPLFFLKQITSQILFGLKILKKCSKPRYTRFTRLLIIHRLNGIAIALGGIAIASCPPVPIVGIIAFVAILGIGIGQLNEDGLYLILGYVTILAYMVITFFILKVYSITKIIEYIIKVF